MTRKQFEAKMKIKERQFNKVRDSIVDIVNDYQRHNPKSDVPTSIEKFVDHLCLTGAWIFDRTQGKIATTHSSQYRGSLTKKIRKALGYTY